MVERQDADGRAEPDGLRQAGAVRDHHQRRRAQAVVVEVVFGVPGGVEAGGLGGNRLLDRVADDLLRRLMVAALLGQDENTEFHEASSATDEGRPRPGAGKTRAL